VRVVSELDDKRFLGDFLDGSYVRDFGVHARERVRLFSVVGGIFHAGTMEADIIGGYEEPLLFDRIAERKLVVRIWSESEGVEGSTFRIRLKTLVQRAVARPPS